MKGMSMQERVSPRPGDAVFIWQWGLGIGALLGLIQLIISVLSLGLFRTILDLLVWLSGFFLISMFSARHTGRVRTGTLAGLITGLSSGLTGVIFGIMQLMMNGPQVSQALDQAMQTAQQQGRNISPGQLQTIATVGIVIGLIGMVVVELGLGAGIGALGGLLGRRQAIPPSNAHTS